MTIREKIIQHYIKAYNHFDTDAMVKDLDESIEFENISGSETNLYLKGLKAFKEQAEQARNYFSERKQKIISFQHEGDETTIEIDYHGILAIDLPNGLKKGEALTLKGKSIFTFRNHTIIKLTDIS